MSMKKIITISRQFGAGGSTIGNMLSKRLGFEFYDKELILQSARRSNIDVESVLKWDEDVPVNFGFAQSLFDFYNKPLSETLYHAQSKAIIEIAEKGNCILVGRNADHILKNFDQTLHVFISADVSWRVEHMKRKMPDTSESRIIEELRLIDKKRKKYCAYYTDKEFGDASGYDICLSTSSLGIEKCVDILEGLARE